MPCYKLIYFNFRGRAEVSRYLFALSGVEYEDFRMEYAEWNDSDVKRDSSFGQVPILQVDDKTLYQSHAIERHLARKFGLAGNTEWDQARVDMVVECLEHYIRPSVGIIFQSEPQKTESIRKFAEEHAPKCLDSLEKMLKENKDGYFVGNTLTLADVAFCVMVTLPCGVTGPVPHSWDRWPSLKALSDRVESHPRIKEWIKRRPVTDM